MSMVCEHASRREGENGRPWIRKWAHGLIPLLAVLGTAACASATDGSASAESSADDASELRRRRYDAGTPVSSGSPDAGSVTPPPTPPPSSTPPAAGGGATGAKPTEANTGWQPTGVTLVPSGDINVSVNGTIVDGKDVSGVIVVNANNVTIRRTRVRSGSYFPINIQSGTNVVVEDVEVDGQGLANKGILIGGNSQVIVQRTNIHDCEDGMALGSTGNTVIRNNFVHSPRHPPDAHSDGVESLGGSHMLIQNNNFDYRGANTSATNFSNYGGPIDDITYDHNWLAGGAYMMYIDGTFGGGPISNFRVTNNVFVRNSSAYGTHVVRGNLSNITWTGNTYDDGQPLPE